MTPIATWSPEAQLDLEEIAFYIAVNDARPATAERIIREARALCDLIATQPEMGESRPEFGVDYRIVSFKHRWVILYRPTDTGVDVVCFVDGKRDFDRLFRQI